jgi:16S rRNA (adenine1518-N6/adenine1519-N6)-dimethyltransferase
VGPDSRVLEIGAGLGSLTAALAASGAEVVAVELDPALVPALNEVVGHRARRVRIEVQDALRADWGSLLDGPGRWTLVANLPYNVAVPVLMRILDEEPRIDRFLVMVQREVGERLAARPGDPQYGAVSVKVAYRARAVVLRRVSPSVFWPRPKVESVLVQMERIPPPVDVEAGTLWRLIEVAFAQRRKNMRGAMIRLGLAPAAAARALEASGIRPQARPEELGLAEFASLAERWLAELGAASSP